MNCTEHELIRALAEVVGQARVIADGPDLERLYDTNLVSGVVCAREPRVHHDE